MRRIRFVLIAELCALIICADSWAISWETDLDSALQRAKSGNKPVMADFYTDWCGWCKKLDKDVYEDEAVNRLSEKFICVKVNCEVDKAAYSKYGLRGYPTVIFFNSSGNAEDTLVGYRNAQAFAESMRRMLEKVPANKAASGNPTPAPAAEKEKMVPGSFKLTGIMGPRAIVNDSLVSVGDIVDNAEVIAIKKNSVSLRYKNNDITVKLQ